MQPPKSEYVPYPHYQRVVKAKREKEERLEEQLRLTQMASRKKKKDQSKPKLVHHPITPSVMLIILLLLIIVGVRDVGKTLLRHWSHLWVNLAEEF